MRLPQYIQQPFTKYSNASAHALVYVRVCVCVRALGLCYIKVGQMRLVQGWLNFFDWWVHSGFLTPGRVAGAVADGCSVLVTRRGICGKHAI